MAGVIKYDLTCRKFGKLFVLHRSDDKGNGKKPVVKWVCRCECGKETSASSYALLSGHTVSCGCKKIKHMESYKHRTRLYNIWKCMRQRCNNPNNPSYPHYGGKGVRICSDWREYASFKKWAELNGYNDSLSIDRIDVNGNYEPTNCRWADNKTQMNNTTRNRKVSYHGDLFTMAEIADIANVSYSKVQHRVERGQSLENL